MQTMHLDVLSEPNPAKVQKDTTLNQQEYPLETLNDEEEKSEIHS